MKIRCLLGFHEPSKYITYRLYGVDYQVCRWCHKRLKPKGDKHAEKALSGLLSEE